MILKIFLYWRLCLFAVAFLGALAFTQIPNGAFGAISPNKSFDYWLSWAQWDGGHYLKIAQEGYLDFKNIAFFPLYPFLTKSLSLLIGNNLLLTGLIIANVSFFSFLIFFNKFVSWKFSNSIAKNAIITYFLFPTSFFAVAYYSEGLYLLLSTSAFMFFYKKKYLICAISLALCTLTRNTGLLLFIALAADLSMRLKDQKPQVSQLFKFLLFTLVALAPFTLYCIYLITTYGKGPLDFIAVQAYWGREVIDPITTVFSYIWSMVTFQARPLLDYIDLFFTIVFFAFLIWKISKLPRAIWIYSMLVILIPASTGTLTSMPRYLLASVGAFILIGDLVTRYQRFKIVIWSVFLSLQIFLLVRFINGYWAG